MKQHLCNIDTCTVQYQLSVCHLDVSVISVIFVIVACPMFKSMNLELGHPSMYVRLSIL